MWRGSYRVRLTKNGKIYETPLRIDLDPRAPYTLEERKAQFAAAMRVHALFERMSDLSERIVALREQAAAKAAALADGERSKRRLLQLVTRIEDVRRQIVATKEGGAITGEERLREHMDALYGAIVGWEGRPGSYQLQRIDALERELGEVEAEFVKLLEHDARPLGVVLAARASGGGSGSAVAAR